MSRIQFRRDTKSSWNIFNPVLADGEIGIEKDTHRFKLGNGIDSWDKLTYSSATFADDPVAFLKNFGISNVVYRSDGLVDTLIYEHMYKIAFTYENSLVKRIDYLFGDDVVKRIDMFYNEFGQLISHT